MLAHCATVNSFHHIINPLYLCIKFGQHWTSAGQVRLACSTRQVWTYPVIAHPCGQRGRLEGQGEDLQRAAESQRKKIHIGLLCSP